MGEDLYRLISAGLLGAIVLLLLLGVSQLARLQKSVGASQGSNVPEPAEPTTEPAEADPVSDEPAVAIETPAVEEDTGRTGDVTEATAPDEEGPFERDGRWWFRRDGDLLVYDEQLEEWVDPNAAPAAQPEQETAEPEPVATESVALAPEPTVEAAPEVEPHPLDEAREWKAPAQSAPVTETTPIEEASPAPIPEPVSAPAPITETSEGAQGESGTHWKCPACGVINGSTASSCRMCFAARP
jgi:hypothetical protein